MLLIHPEKKNYAWYLKSGKRKTNASLKLKKWTGWGREGEKISQKNIYLFHFDFNNAGGVGGDGDDDDGDDDADDAG